jgi:hypothetical protein
MKRLVSSFALLALLAMPAPAMAKELTNVSVCGPDACAAITGETNLHNFGASGEPDGSVPGPAPFYEIRYTFDAEGESQQWSSWYVPSAKRLASVDERTGVAWAPLDEPRLAVLARGLKPFARPEISSVTIGSRKITDNPASYLRLFTVKSAGEAVPHGLADWEPVVFHANDKTPWTLEQTSLFYSPSNGMLQRGIEMVKLPRAMSADIRSGESLADGSGSGFPWRTVFFALLAAVALLIVASTIRPLRRRVFVRRAPTTA